MSKNTTATETATETVNTIPELILEMVAGKTATATPALQEARKAVAEVNLRMEEAMKAQDLNTLFKLSAELATATAKCTKAEANEPKAKPFTVAQVACLLLFEYGYLPAQVKEFGAGVAYVMHSAGLQAKTPSVRTTCTALFHAAHAGHFEIPERTPFGVYMAEKVQELMQEQPHIYAC